MNLLPWCVAVPFACAALLLALSAFVGRLFTTIFSVTAAVATAVLCALVLRAAATAGTLVYWFGGWHPGNGVGLGIAFGVGPLGASLAFGIAFVTIALLVFAHRLFDNVGDLFDVIVLVHLGAAIAIVYTTDLFDLLVFYELTNVAEFALAGFSVTKRLAVRGAFNFAIATGLGAFAIIFGLTLLEGLTGQLNAAAIGEALTRVPAPALAACAFGLLASGLLIKAAVPPFHFWFIDAQTAAPAPVGVMFSGIVSVLGIYALERAWTIAFANAPGPSAALVHDLLEVFGGSGALVMAVLAFTAADLKRALAYAAASNTALFAAAGIAAADQSLVATVYLVMGFAFPIAALAMWIGMLDDRLKTVVDDEYAGRARHLVITLVVSVIAIAGIAGIPPVPTAIGRALLDPPLTACSVFAGGLIAARFIVAAWNAYVVRSDEPLPDHGRDNTRWFLVGPALVLGVAAFALGIIPWSRVTPAVMAFANTHTMADALLHHPLAIAYPPLGAPALATVLLLAVATLAVAAAGVGVRPVIRRLAAIKGLHAIHNGSVGDYVTWLAGGTAAITATLVLIARR